MPIDDAVKKEIMRSSSADSIRQSAKVFTLKDHGLLLAKEGITTLAEVFRVVKMEV